MTKFRHGVADYAFEFSIEFRPKMSYCDIRRGT